jgi:glycosyltransferase involved in cell wall biosynthesis
MLCTLPTDESRTRDWMHQGLVALGHDVHLVDRPDLPPDGAASLGYGVAASWQTGAADAVLALGWVAGLAALVATRESPAPVLLRLPRPGRSGSPTVTRVERALIRGGATLLAASPAEAEVLAGLGAPRARLRVLPEAVDPTAVPPAIDDLVVITDDSGPQVAALLEAMAAGRPAVVRDRGVLADVVADGVSGLVVPPHGDLAAAVNALRSDLMRREAMGMAAADRVQACFDIAVVVPMLGRLLDEVQLGALAAV